MEVGVKGKSWCLELLRWKELALGKRDTGRQGRRKERERGEERK